MPESDVLISAGSSGERRAITINGKGSDMIIQKSGGSVRKPVTRVVATAVLLLMYAFGMIATTGALGVSPAFAQRGRGRGRGGGDIGAAIGLGVGAAILGGAIAAQQAETERQQAIDYCMQRFRSYDPQSMTYMGRDGLRHPCP
jgi:hypothetical protein